MFIDCINYVALENPKTAIQIFYSYFQTDASEINRVSWSGNLQFANLQFVQNLFEYCRELTKVVRSTPISIVVFDNLLKCSFEDHLQLVDLHPQ
jgi:hypothetical protein